MQERRINVNESDGLSMPSILSQVEAKNLWNAKTE